MPLRPPDVLAIHNLVENSGTCNIVDLAPAIALVEVDPIALAGQLSQHGRHYSVEENTVGFGDDAPLFDWFCLDWMWADLQPREGKYYWDDLDQVMEYWAERGKQINLRVWVTDDPGWAGDSGADEVCPNWVWEAGAACHEYVDEGGRTIKEPDYPHPTYKTTCDHAIGRFLAAAVRNASDNARMWRW